jgi:ribokinase
MEIPLEENWKAISAAKAANVLTILNNAPAGNVPAHVLAELDFLVVNEAEAQSLVDLHSDSILAWCATLRAKPSGSWATGKDFVKRTSLVALACMHHVTIIITLGSQGAEIFCPEEGLWLRAPALGVEVVDTVGAGDAFVGAFAAMLAKGCPLVDCMERGIDAGSLACTVHGAQVRVCLPSLRPGERCLVVHRDGRHTAKLHAGHEPEGWC